MPTCCVRKMIFYLIYIGSLFGRSTSPSHVHRLRMFEHWPGCFFFPVESGGADVGNHAPFALFSLRSYVGDSTEMLLLLSPVNISGCKDDKIFLCVVCSGIVFSTYCSIVQNSVELNVIPGKCPSTWLSLVVLVQTVYKLKSHPK